MRGQSQFLIIAGILVFVIVVVIFTTQKSFIFPPDSASNDIKKALKAEIDNKIRSQAFETIEVIGKRGGYLQVSETSTRFGGEDVPYWQICQNKAVPTLINIIQNIKNDIQTKLNSKKITDFEGKKVSVGDVQNIEIIVRQDDLIVRVWMPTKVESIELDQPYQVILPIELGRAYEFASAFTSENSENRHLSTFIASLLYHLPETTLPTTGLLTKCGESIAITYEEAKSSVESILDHASLNTVFWEDQPEDTEYLDYYIPNVQGKQFQDLDIFIHKTGELGRKTFQTSMNPIVISNSKTLYKFLPYCVKPYDVSYNVQPSFAVSVKTRNNFKFNFGLMPFVKNSRIGNCEGAESLVEIADVCSQAKCDLKLLVEGLDGYPVPDTKVMFSSCNLGKTDENGLVEGKIPCSISQLSAFNPDYAPFYDIKSGVSLKGETITLRKGPLLKMHFNRAIIEEKKSYLPLFKKIGYDVTTSSNQEERIIVEIKQKDGTPWNVFESIISNDNPEKGLVNTVVVDYIPEGKYDFTVNSFKKLKLFKRICTHKELGGLGKCDRRKTIDVDIAIPTTIKQEFEIKGNTTDIYLTAFYPIEEMVSDVPNEYNYTLLADTLSKCVSAVSENPADKVCEILL